MSVTRVTTRGHRHRPAALVAVALAAALGCLGLTAATSTARAADVSFTQTALSASVSDSRVSASTTVEATTPTTVVHLKVCVRSASDENADFTPSTDIPITAGGTTWTGTKVFGVGDYTYFACALLADGTWWGGPSARFTVSGSGPQPVARVTKLLTVIEENHSLAQMQNGMPYLYGLAQQYGYAADYTAITHPSLPNYLAIAGGDTFGVGDDNDPADHVIHGPSIFGQALAAGMTARTYAESMPDNCTLTGNTDKGYAVKHNPWAYFADERSSCAAHDLSAHRFLADAAADNLPAVGMLVPNKCNDAHDTDLGCDLGTADNWLAARLPTVLASADFTSGRLAVVVTADEDDTSAGSGTDDGVLTVVLQAGLDGTHTVVTTPLTHYSLSRLYSEVVGAAPLRNAATAPDMAAAFGLTVGPASAGSR